MITGYSKFGKTLVVLLALTILNGCVGYQLGSMLPADIKTVHVPTFINDTSEPLIESEATQATVIRLQQDGSLKVVKQAQADAILEVELKEYKLEPVSFERNKETRANEYRIILKANVVLKRAATDEVIVQIPKVSGEADFIFSGNLSSAKQSAFPEAARDLAHDIVEKVVEAW